MELVQQKIKKRAARTMKQPAQLISEELVAVSPAALRGLQRNNLRKLIQRRRTAVRSAPPNPPTLSQLDIPRSYQLYCPLPGQGW